MTITSYEPAKLYRKPSLPGGSPDATPDTVWVNESGRFEVSKLYRAPRRYGRYASRWVHDGWIVHDNALGTDYPVSVLDEARKLIGHILYDEFEVFFWYGTWATGIYWLPILPTQKDVEIYLLVPEWLKRPPSHSFKVGEDEAAVKIAMLPTRGFDGGISRLLRHFAHHNLDRLPIRGSFEIDHQRTTTA